MPFNLEGCLASAANMLRLHAMNPRFLIFALVVVGSTVALGEFKFKHHFIDRDLPAKDYGQTCLVDVDRDGDLDICSKLWEPRKDNANGGRNHVDYLENLRIQKKN